MISIGASLVISQPLCRPGKGHYWTIDPAQEYMFEEGSFRCVYHLVLCNGFRKFLKFGSLFVHHLLLFIKSKEIYIVLYNLNLYLPGGDQGDSGEKQWSHIRALFTHHAGTDCQRMDRKWFDLLNLSSSWWPSSSQPQYWWCTIRPRLFPIAAMMTMITMMTMLTILILDSTGGVLPAPDGPPVRHVSHYGDAPSPAVCQVET